MTSTRLFTHKFTPIVGCCFDFCFGVDLTSCRFCLLAAVTSARRFFVFWWDFLGVDGTIVGVLMEGRWGKVVEVTLVLRLKCNAGQKLA